jgi:peptide/nickel transport system permease protein
MRRFQNVLRLLRYTAIRGLAVGSSVVIGIYLSILIVNMGGYVDKIKESQIREGVGMAIHANPQYNRLPPEQVAKIVEHMVELEKKRLGLDKPFIYRSIRYLADALSLHLGRSEHITSNSGSKNVWRIFRERLPITLELFGIGNILYFFISVLVALYLSRRYGSIADKTTIALAPLSAAPSWFWGVLYILIFAALLGILPFGGLLDAPPPATRIGYILNHLKHLILPLLAWLVPGIFMGIYNWRTFFLIYSSEDYVEMAKAKGVSERALERRYILRPTLPPIITSFALMLISSWMGAIILETVFNWPGVGMLYWEAIGAFDTPVVVGELILYAYLLAITVYLLDIIYAIVDPRIRVGGKKA